MSNEVYSPTIREHLEHPRNEGPLPRPDAVGVRGNPICGDTMKLMLRIEAGRVTQARWQTVGCEPSRALSSLATELVEGRPLAEVEAVSAEQLTELAGGLPASKLHAATLAAGALQKAIAGYQTRKEE